MYIIAHIAVLYLVFLHQRLFFVLAKMCPFRFVNLIDDLVVQKRRYTSTTSRKMHFLQLTRVDNGGALLVLDGAGARASGLESLDNVEGFLVGDLAKNDVATVQPGGDDGGDEELGAVAVEWEG